MTETPPTEPVSNPIKDLSEYVRDALAGDAPLIFAGVKKAIKTAGAKVTGKNKVTDDEIRSTIADLVLEGRAFKHPSGAKGVERYWSHDEKDRIREAVLSLAATATPFAKLHATAKGLFKGTLPEFAEGVVRELIGEEKLHEHPAKKAGGPALYATTRPKSAEEIEAEKRKEEEEKAEKKRLEQEAKAEKKRVEKEEKAEKKRLEQEAKAATEQRQKTLDAVAALGDDPVPEAKLGKPKASASAAVQAVYQEVLKELLDAGKLFAHGSKYGTHPPAQPKWYETAAYKKPFDKLLKAGADALSVDAQPASVVFGELLARLNVSLVPVTSTLESDLSGEIVAFVERWAEEYKAGCPFDKLYDHLAASGTSPTIGRFHDLLRDLDQTNRLRLSGWPKGLYELARAELALVNSNKLYYYANPISWGV